MLEQVKRWVEHIEVERADNIIEEHFTILLFISPRAGESKRVYEERLGYTKRSSWITHLANTY